MRFVPVKGLQSGMVLARDINNSKKTLMLKKGMVLNDSIIERLDNQGYIGAYISDLFSEEVDLKETIDQELFCDGVRAVKEENIGSIFSVAANIVSDITKQDDISLNLLDLRSADDYTYHHSVNVAVYCVVVGKKLGLDEKDLKYISEAAICHDLGKTKIDEAILNKPGRLTDEEYQEIKNHPKYSYDILYRNSRISSKVRQAILCHHENENGTGYPLGKEGKDIPLLAKIIHAVDVYDALTSKRVYKEPYQPVDAFEYLKSGKGILFDAKVVDAMIEIIPAFPPGIDVALSNGENALVIKNTSNALRPKIKLTETGKIINLDKDESYKDVYIVKSGIMPSDYVSEIEILNEDRSAVHEIKERVLVVDDNLIALKQMVANLEEEYHVIPIKSGIEAIRYLSENKNIDVLIIDTDMHMMDGITTAKKIRKMGRDDLPLIFISSSSDKETILKCREVGATDFIIKPVKPLYIRERVAVALKKNFV